MKLFAIVHQQLPPAGLSAALRELTGKNLRRTAELHQLAVLGALTCLPEALRQQPTALLWQSCSGPRRETQKLLDEVCRGDAEPMPYDFLATQPALAAPQLQAFVPGLRIASHLPLASDSTSAWTLLLLLAHAWLQSGRYELVLCAQLDSWASSCSGHWLALGNQALALPALASVHLGCLPEARQLPDTPDFPQRLAQALGDPLLGDIGLAGACPGGPVFTPVC